MNFEKAFKSLSYLIDRSANWDIYSKEEMDEYYALACWYKKAIESFAHDSNSKYEAYGDIANFEYRLEDFDLDICESELYIPWKEGV